MSRRRRGAGLAPPSREKEHPASGTSLWGSSPRMEA